MNRLKGAKSCYGMACRQSLKKAIITSSLAMPERVEIVANFVGLWPLRVLYLKETGGKANGVRVVVRFFPLDCISTSSSPCILFL